MWIFILLPLSSACKEKVFQIFFIMTNYIIEYCASVLFSENLWDIVAT